MFPPFLTFWWRLYLPIVELHHLEPTPLLPPIQERIVLYCRQSGHDSDTCQEKAVKRLWFLRRNCATSQWQDRSQALQQHMAIPSHARTLATVVHEGLIDVAR